MGIGPDFSTATLEKARKAVQTGLVERDQDHPTIWWVTSERDSAQVYRVQTDFDPPVRQELSWITCTCPHGLKTGGGYSRCYHTAAVLLMILERRRLR